MNSIIRIAIDAEIQRGISRMIKRQVREALQSLEYEIKEEVYAQIGIEIPADDHENASSTEHVLVLDEADRNILDAISREYYETRAKLIQFEDREKPHGEKRAMTIYSPDSWSIEAMLRSRKRIAQAISHEETNVRPGVRRDNIEF